MESEHFSHKPDQLGRDYAFIVVAKAIEPNSVLEALNLSIQKWEYIVWMYTEGPGKDLPIAVIDGGSRTCALCKMYIDEGCSTCPVMRETRMNTCKGTPYRPYVTFLNDALYETGRGLDTDTCNLLISLAKDEVTFLKSLQAQYA